MPVQRGPTAGTGRSLMSRALGLRTLATGITPRGWGRGGAVKAAQGGKSPDGPGCSGPPAPARTGWSRARTLTRRIRAGGRLACLAPVRPSQVDAGEQRQWQGDRRPGQGCDPHPVHRPPVLVERSVGSGRARSARVRVSRAITGRAQDEPATLGQAEDTGASEADRRRAVALRQHGRRTAASGEPSAASSGVNDDRFGAATPPLGPRRAGGAVRRGRARAGSARRV